VRPVSSRFLAAVGSSHRMDVRARVVPAGLNGVLPSTILGTLDVVSGAVTYDSSAQIWASLDLETSTYLKGSATSSWPTVVTDPLTPYGHEVFVERGVVYGDGSREWVSQGYFRINTVEQQDAPLGSVHVTGQDRMAGIIDARFTTPMVFTAGTTVASVIQTIVTDVYSWATFDLDSSLTTATLTTDQTTTDDRYGFLSDLVKAYGMVMRWDYRGVFWVHQQPSTTTPVATIKAGSGGVLVSLSRSLGRQGVYNGVVASGQQLSETVPPVTATVFDTDPNSPTLWGGPFGKVPMFYSSSFLTTTDQCTSAGTSLLAQNKGVPYSVDFGQVPNPALEPYDPVVISYPGHREQHVISQLVVPLDPSTAQTAQTRQLLTGSYIR
jgi:uncharacterized protein DUF5047